MVKNVEAGSSFEEEKPLSKERMEVLKKIWVLWDEMHIRENTPEPEEVAKEMNISVEEFNQFIKQANEESDKWEEEYRKMRRLDEK